MRYTEGPLTPALSPSEGEREKLRAAKGVVQVTDSSVGSVLPDPESSLDSESTRRRLSRSRIGRGDGQFCWFAWCGDFFGLTTLDYACRRIFPLRVTSARQAG
jgi:hypothetical protein